MKIVKKNPAHQHQVQPAQVCKIKGFNCIYLPPGEPDERCSSEGGYCMKVSSCPNGDYVDNKCPGDNTIKCCLSAPFQVDTFF